MADGSPRVITPGSVDEAERDYELAIRRAPGVSSADADLDIMRLAAIADHCAETARKAWREYRATSDEGDRREATTAAVARQIGDVLAGSFGMSREAAVLLDRMIERVFA